MLSMYSSTEGISNSWTWPAANTSPARSEAPAATISGLAAAAPGSTHRPGRASCRASTSR